jgi:hypothetical protein
MQLAKKIPFDDPNVLNACRAVYLISNLVIFGIYLYTKSIIDRKKGMRNLSTRVPILRSLAYCGRVE